MKYVALQGTASQIEWAGMIRVRVAAEFDRVSEAFARVAGRQGPEDSVDTAAILAILEEKRVEVLSRDKAGYFIETWQELTDQVRLLIFNDPRYTRIRQNRLARRGVQRAGQPPQTSPSKPPPPQ